MLPFIPRKVARKVTKAQVFPTSSDKSKLEQIAGPSGTTSSQPPETIPSQPSLKGKGRETTGFLSENAYADLLRLSFSDHALWLDPTLRRALESSPEGYIPLTLVLHHSPYLSPLIPPPPEALLAKAIRAHAADVFDIRVLFSEPSRAMWFGNATGNRDNVGGYEIRLKEGEDALNRARNSNREIWETSTVYMENIPLQYRSIPGIYQFSSMILVPDSSSFSTGSTVVQSISLPRHHQDKPTDQPKCKGFALVTLSAPELANRLVEEWHWQRKSGVDEDKESLDSNTLLHDAHKFGFRVLHKSRWDELKEEYLARRTQLLERVAAKADDEMEVDPHKNEEEEEETFSHKRKRSPTPPPLPPPLAPPATKPSQSTTTLHSRYPHGCLIFVKNVHPETNKTTLRTLFSRAFPDEQQGVGLDYVDFTKGMNSCYLRLATPTHTTHLLAHFKDTPTTQTHGLDTTGSSNASINAVVMEVVDGKREELYWEKVPEKVRRQAVEKAVKGLSRGGGEAGDGGEGGQRKRQRKRRGE